MKYCLVTTKDGQVPIHKIKEGTEVLCYGQWVRAPAPEMGTVLTCSFDTLPTTSFDKRYVSGKREVFCNHRPVLNKLERIRLGLTVRGYLREVRKKSTGSPGVGVEASDISFWYPRLIDFFDMVVYPKYLPDKNQIIVFQPFPDLKELEGNELAERNLEYYLEGMLRRRMFWEENWMKLSGNLSESERMVLRLLDIDCVSYNVGTIVTNPVSFLKHVKDERNKSKFTDDMLRIMLTQSYDLPQYTPGCRIKSRVEERGWILPGINPDINCLSAWKWESFDKVKNPQVRKHVRTLPVDKLGKVYGNGYRTDNLWEKFQRELENSCS